MEFSNFEKDKINDETCELLEPYFSLTHFNPQAAKKSSMAAEGLFTWIEAMREYREIYKTIKPKYDQVAMLNPSL